MTTPDVGLLPSVHLTEPETFSNTVHSPAVINNSSLIPEMQERLAIAQSSTGAGEGSNFTHVTNADFMAEVFHKIPDGAYAAVCTKPGDPTTGGWTARRADKSVNSLQASHNNYLNYSSFKIGSDGAFNVQVENFAAYHGVVLDDVGTKIPLTSFDGITPSWKLETSPGNYQVGFILKEPITDIAVVSQLQKAIIAKGLSDPGTTGPSHYVRLPVAINGKKKYATADGKPFRCSLDHWRPDVRFTINDIVEGLALELAPVQPVLETITSVHVPASLMPAPLQGDPDREPPNMVALTSALKGLTPDCDESTWKFYRIAPLANEAQLSPELRNELYALARSWSSGELGGVPSVKWLKAGSKGASGKQCFDRIWQRFLTDTKYPKEKKASLGTIYFHAKALGWNYADACRQADAENAQ